jgi:hypothetical protein
MKGRWPALINNVAVLILNRALCKQIKGGELAKFWHTPSAGTLRCYASKQLCNAASKKSDSAKYNVHSDGSHARNNFPSVGSKMCRAGTLWKRTQERNHLV